MSNWQTYVDSNLVGSGKLKEGAIYGPEGNKYATSPSLQITNDEIKKVIAAFKDPSDIRAKGFTLSTKKYVALKCDDRSVYGKLGASGVVCVKTGKTILIGVYDDKTQPGQATAVVEKLADYLIENNY